MYYLMVKTHNVTGLKYLCMTKKQNPYTYKGSGKYWKRHLKKYGSDISTDIIFSTIDYEELKQKGIYYSVLWNVVVDSAWANLREECGDGGDTVSSKIWITDGVNNKYHNKNDNIPEGWYKGRVGTVFSDSAKQREFGLRARKNDVLLKENDVEEYERKKKQTSQKMSAAKKEYFKNNPEAKLKLHNSSKRLILDGDFFNSIKEACLKHKVGRIKIKRWIAEGRGQFL